MPICGKDSNFKGKKERSGRYSVADEALKNRVKHKAWTKTEAEMDKNGAIQIVLKDMTVKMEHSVGLSIEYYDEAFKIASEAKGSNPQPIKVQDNPSGQESR